MRCINRISFDCFEEIVARNMDFEGESVEGSERKEESCRQSFCFLGKTHCHEQNVARNMNVNGASGKVSERKNILFETG